MDGGRTPEETVAKRAQARLDALRAWDLKEALRYHTPAYRDAYGVGELSAAYGGARRWISAEVDDVACELERCVVTFIVDYQFNRPSLRNKKPLSETWVFIDGGWYAVAPD